MQAKQTKDAETAKKDLRDIMNVVITLNALLKVAKDAGDGDLQKSLQETIFQEDKKMVDAVAAWVMATRGEPEKEDRSDEQEKAIDSSLERMRKQADRNEKAGAREKSYDGNDEKQISRLQKAGVLLGFGCNTSEPFKSYPQWKPRTSTGGNSKLEGTCITFLSPMAYANLTYDSGHKWHRKEPRRRTRELWYKQAEALDRLTC